MFNSICSFLDYVRIWWELLPIILCKLTDKNFLCKIEMERFIVTGEFLLIQKPLFRSARNVNIQCNTRNFPLVIMSSSFSSEETWFYCFCLDCLQFILELLHATCRGYEAWNSEGGCALLMSREVRLSRHISNFNTNVPLLYTNRT